jgi:hypothetical protein
MPVDHVFGGVGADTADPRVEQFHLRRPHLSPPFCLMSMAEQVERQWFNQPATDTPIFSTPPAPTVMADCQKVAQLRLIVNVVVAGAAGARIGVKAFDPSVFTWLEASAVANAGSVLIATVGLKDTGWFNVRASVNTNPITMLQLWGWGGNGVADPSIGLVAVYAK